jgi:PKD repeat protein
VQLPAAAHGSAAVAALGAHLPGVAKAYGLEAQTLVTLFQTQPSLGVDSNATLLFACEGLAVKTDGSLVHGRGRAEAGAADVMAPNSSVTLIASGSTVDAFKLHSLPGVTRVIYLDFNGHATSGTSWNSAYASGATIVSAAFDLDGDSSTFNASERGLIQRIWQRVAEDYAPFAVDVTTEDPGVDALRKSASGDNAFGIRVVISPTNWYKSSAGGVAYIGSFSWNSDTPCFAFTQQLASGEKYIAEAVAHEVGHTLSLYHDGASGTSATEYYTGHGNWAPIMGVGYYKTVVQFSKGEYANANNTQDDLTVIATHVPVAVDDHGNTPDNATPLSGPSVGTGGTIETRADVDVFRIDASAGALSLEIKGPGPDSNLDLKAELLNSSGQVLQMSDTAGSLSASVSATLPAGTFYIRLSGVGSGASASTGYTNYASIGNYIITGSYSTSGVKQPPVAVATSSTTSGTAPLAVTFYGHNSTDPDSPIVSYDWNFGDGNAASGMTASTTYSSPGAYSAVLTVVDSDGLAASATVTINVTAPANIAPTASAQASITSGTAPVSVNFTSTGSVDPDGTIASYKWEFGDGTSATGATATKVYINPGNYIARLTVTDDRGATAISTVVISALGNADLDADVSQFVLTTSTAKSGSTGTATIVVLDRKNRAVSGATLSVQWSGVVTSSVTARTDVTGRVVLTSPKTKKAGALTAAITNVAAPDGRVYDAAIYGEPLVRTVTLK